MKKSRTPRLVAVAVAVLIVLAVGVGIGSTMLKNDRTHRSAADSSSVTNSSSSDGLEPGAVDTADDVLANEVMATPTTTTLVPTTIVTTTTDPEQGAFEALLVQIQADRDRADSSIAESWVPQLGSKKLGITDKETGITYSTYQSILDDFRSSQQRLGDVLLLDSGAFSTFSTGGLVVTVADISFSTAEEANNWCDGQGLSPNNCFAKFLSHTTPSGPDMQEYRG